MEILFAIRRQRLGLGEVGHGRTYGRGAQQEYQRM